MRIRLKYGKNTVEIRLKYGKYDAHTVEIRQKYGLVVRVEPLRCAHLRDLSRCGVWARCGVCGERSGATGGGGGAPRGAAPQHHAALLRVRQPHALPAQHHGAPRIHPLWP
eukprot:1187988-Prorocentrum_minimum.AAC.1